jgi:hypothetical protein
MASRSTNSTPEAIGDHHLCPGITRLGTMIWALLPVTAIVTRSLRTKYSSNRPTTGVSFRDAASTIRLDAWQIPTGKARFTRQSGSETHSTPAPLRDGREPRPNWKPYVPKSSPGVFGERFSDDSGAAEAGSSNSGEPFFTFPTALSPSMLSSCPRRKDEVGQSEDALNQAFNQRS